MKKNEIYILLFCLIGFFFQLLANVRVDGENYPNAPIYWTIGTTIVVFTLCIYARLKGYGIWLGLMGFLSIYGIVFLIFMPYKEKTIEQSEEHWLFNSKVTMFCFIISFILFLYSLRQVPRWEMDFTYVMQSIFWYLSIFLFIFGSFIFCKTEHKRILAYNKSDLWKFIAHIPLLRLVVLSPPDLDDSEI